MPGERGRPCCSRQVLAMWACAILLPLAMRAALARTTLPPPMPPPAAAAPGEWPSPPGGGFTSGHAPEHTVSCGGVPAIMNVSAQGRGVVSGRLEARYVSGAGGAVTGQLVPVPQPCPGNKVLAGGWEQPGPWVAVVPLPPLGYVDCPLADKVRHLARAGAAALLLFGDALEERHAIEEAARDARLLHGNTSAVVAGRAVGDEIVRLARNYSSSGTVFLTMGPAQPCTRTYGAAVNRTSVLFVSISFVVLMIISLAWLVFYYVQRFRYIHAKDRLSRRLCSAAKKALSKIPTKNIKSEDKEIQGDGECCAVCIEPYKVSDVLRILPCRHEFHKSCIDPWLLEHRTCPMCKMDILKHYGFVFTGSQESILHMEIEEVVGLGQAEGHDNDVESLTASPQMRPANGVMSIPSSPEMGSHSSGASTPNELSPALSVGPRFASSRHSASTSNRTTNTAALRDQVCSNCGSGLTKPVPADTVADTCIVELQESAMAEADDCDLESCASNGTSPQHSSNASK